MLSSTTSSHHQTFTIKILRSRARHKAYASLSLRLVLVQVGYELSVRICLVAVTLPIPSDPGGRRMQELLLICQPNMHQRFRAYHLHCDAGGYPGPYSGVSSHLQVEYIYPGVAARIEEREYR